MSDLNRIATTDESKMTAIDYSLFVSVVVIIAIAVLDAADGSVSQVFMSAIDALTAAISA